MFTHTSLLLLFALSLAGKVSSESIECNPDCDYDEGYFCGIDGKCHPYNCKNFYDYGIWRDNGLPIIREKLDVQLNCERIMVRIQPTVNDYCGGGLKKSCAYCSEPQNGDVIKQFTRRCEVEPVAGGKFECYDFLADTSFASFQRQAEIVKFPCESPVFMYQAQYKINGDEGTVTPFQAALPFFDITLAYRTLQASLDYEGGSPTISDFTSPTTSPTAVDSPTSNEIDPLPEVKCDPDCNYDEGEFCGIDGQCRRYNCAFWYNYGSWRQSFPGSITGRLDCSKISGQIDIDENGSCNDGLKRSCAYCNKTETGEVIKEFTRYCKAEPFPGSQFMCEEFAADTTFTSFERASDIIDYSCENELFFYSFQYDVNGESYLPYQANGTFFDVEKAYTTMRASLDYKSSPSPATTPTASSSPTKDMLSYAYYYRN